ncbi:MAG TPA: hypothetical protein VGI54_11570, partial [Solirubrobacteraceae bacterium]
IASIALYGAPVGQAAHRLARVSGVPDGDALRFPGHALRFTPDKPGRWVLYSLATDARDNHQTKAFKPIHVRVGAG